MAICRSAVALHLHLELVHSSISLLHLGLELVDASVDLGVLVLRLVLELGDVGGDLGLHADHLLRLEGLAHQELGKHGFHISFLILRFFDSLTRAFAKSILCSCFSTSFAWATWRELPPQRGRRPFGFVLAETGSHVDEVAEVLGG